jgi:DNA mismatch repair ATPase MutS
MEDDQLSIAERASIKPSQGLITDEYFLYVEKYTEIYGRDTVVLLQNGSFFEMYAIDNEKEKIFPEIRQVCDDLDIFLSRKNKSILENGRHNPLMAGFPTWSYEKHVQNLLDKDYTVVIFQQKEASKGKFERVLSEILSPAIQMEFNKSVDAQFCICFNITVGTEYYSRIEFWNVSTSVIDILTGKIFLYDISHSRLEKKESVLFDMIRVLRIHPSNEIILVLNGVSLDKRESFWRKELDYHTTLHLIDIQAEKKESDRLESEDDSENPESKSKLKSISKTKTKTKLSPSSADSNTSEPKDRETEKNGLAKIFSHHVGFTKISKKIYQKEFFDKMYSHITLQSAMSRIEFLELDKYDNMRISLIILLQFVYNHNNILLSRIQKPEWCEYMDMVVPKYCRIENNSMEQLGLFHGESKKRYRYNKNQIEDTSNKNECIEHNLSASGHVGQSPTEQLASPTGHVPVRGTEQPEVGHVLQRRTEQNPSDSGHVGQSPTEQPEGSHDSSFGSNSLIKSNLKYNNTQYNTCQLTCVFDVLNETKTAIGYRFLKESLAKPLVDVGKIQKRQQHIQIMKGRAQELVKTREMLSETRDVERIHRKIQLGNVWCSDFYFLEKTYKVLLQLLHVWRAVMFVPSRETAMYEWIEKKKLEDALDFISTNIKTDMCQSIPRNQSITQPIFKENIFVDLDHCFKERNTILSLVEMERNKLDEIFCKSAYAKKTKVKEVSQENISLGKAVHLSSEPNHNRKRKRPSEKKEANELGGTESEVQNTKSDPKKGDGKRIEEIHKLYTPGAVDPDVQDSNKEYCKTVVSIEQKSVETITNTPANVKLEYTEKEKYYFSITNTKLKWFQEYSKQNSVQTAQYKIKVQTSNAKITCRELEELNERYTKCLELIDELSRKYFNCFMREFHSRFEEYFISFNFYIGYIDFVQTGAFVSLCSNYVQPEFIDGESSFIDCEQLRHPLVERILNYNQYIPNNINIGVDKSGYLVFGTNSCGKSVYMKSVGISIIMAQIGYDVACTRMKICPFYNIITRMSGMDNALKGQSSFAVEMIELNLILTRSTRRSLVLGDEICHGTEHVSAQSLVASSLIFLCKNKVPFVFASHLHQLSKMDCITALENLAMKHMTVKRDLERNTLVYERLLKDGSGDAIYGIEVAKFIIENKDFILVAERIQRELQNQTLNVVSEKTSRYNPLMFMTSCQVCGQKATETHHIIQQKMANDQKLVYSEKTNTLLHMNHSSNLAKLCEKCHHMIHAKKGKKLIIHGYKDTLEGQKLDYEYK